MIDNAFYFVWSAIIQFFALMVGVIFILVDWRAARREQEKGQLQRVWYCRGLTIGGLMLVVPVLGKALPEMMISLVVFRGFLLPSSSDFDYQIYAHSLVFFTWLSFLTELVTIALLCYAIYLAMKTYRQQREEQQKKG